MRIKFVDKKGNLKELSARDRDAHKENLEFLASNKELESKIGKKVNKEIDDFFSDGREYMNSAEVASRVAKNAGINSMPNCNGIVGSALLKAWEEYPENGYVLIASKGEDQRYFDYFIREK